MSQKELVIGHATTPGVSSDGQQAAHLTMELDYQNQVVWVAVLASSDGFMPDGTTASQYIVSQIYNGLTQSVQPIAPRLREAVYRANLELIGVAGASGNIDRPQVSVLVAAIVNNTLHVAYVGDIVAHLCRDGITFPLTANHTQYAPNAAAQGINNKERLGMYPDMPIHNTLVEQMVRSDLPPFAKEQFRMCDFMVLQKEAVIVLSSKEIQGTYINDTIVNSGSNIDPNDLAQGLVVSPTIVGSADDVTAIVLRTPEQKERRTTVGGRLISALLGFILFAGSFGGLLYAYPELANRLRITAPSAPIEESIVAAAGENDTENANAASADVVETETATPRPTATPQPTSTLTPVQATATTTPAKATETPTDLPTDALADATTGATTDAPLETATKVATPDSENDEEAEPDFSLTVNLNADDFVALLATSAATDDPENEPTSTETPVPPTEVPTESPTATSTATSLPTSTSTPLATATSTFTPPPSPTATSTNTPTPTETPTPRPTATIPTSDIKSLQLVSPQDNAQSGGRQKFEWSYWGTLAPSQRFEVVFWEDGQDPMRDGFGIAGTTANTRLSVDLDRLNQQLPLFRGGVTYQWGILLVTENPYTRLSLLGGGRTFTYSAQGGSSAPDQADE